MATPGMFETIAIAQHDAPLDVLEAAIHRAAASPQACLTVLLDLQMAPGSSVLCFEEYPMLVAILIGDRGWLMVLRDEGDAGFSTWSGADGPTVPFNDGQDVELPIAGAVPRAQAESVLRHFTATAGRVPDGIAWFNDSGDGCASPNDPFEPT